MSYESALPIIKMFYLAHSCPYFFLRTDVREVIIVPFLRVRINYAVSFVPGLTHARIKPVFVKDFR